MTVKNYESRLTKVQKILLAVLVVTFGVNLFVEVSNILAFSIIVAVMLINGREERKRDKEKAH